MYNLLVSGKPWDNARDRMWRSRIFEHTELSVEAQFKHGGDIDTASLITLPTLFVQETSWANIETARVGRIHRLQSIDRDLIIDYAYDPCIPPISNVKLKAMAVDLGIEDSEFARTHWAVKDVDLFYALLRNQASARIQPSLFRLSDPVVIVNDLVSAMMPFDTGFGPVYATLKDAAEEAGMQCQRADDLWENAVIIQDIVALIDRSRLVIADCTSRNPNVFYEIGIAHTLGREVILITQSETDIPFDLRHLRYLRYLNNREGLDQLRGTILKRMQKIATAT